MQKAKGELEVSWALKDWSYEAMKAEQVREYINAVNPKMTTPTKSCPDFQSCHAANGCLGNCTTPTPRTNDVHAYVCTMAGGDDEGHYQVMRDHVEGLEIDLAAAQEWREAVLNELIVAHIYTKEHDTNPRKAIQDAITWNCQVALDPAVSSDARKLVAQERERLDDEISDAIQSDLENGAKWLNELAADDFKRKYPAINAILSRIAAAIRRGE